MKKRAALFGVVVMAALVAVLMLACDTSTSPSPQQEPGLPPLASHIHTTFVNGICTHPDCYMIAMRQLPGGTLTRGGHTITLSGFNMMVFEVTQELFYEVMGVNPSSFGGNPAAGEVQGRRPVENVTWFDAVEFAYRLSIRHYRTPVYTITNRVPASGHPITSATVAVNWDADGYRLPTEAEWEYANRAGSYPAWNWHFGNNAGALGMYAWYINNSDGMTRQVGRKRANAWGLYDTHGNVWEWVWDRTAWPMENFPAASATDPRGPDAGSSRVIRGGSFDDPAGSTHSAIRNGDTPGVRGGNLGFRLVRP